MMKWIKKVLLLWAILVSTGCHEQQHLEEGAATMFVLDPGTGKLLWGADFKGQDLAVAGFRNGHNQLVVEMNDPCWEKPTQFGFSLADGSLEDIFPLDTTAPFPDPCAAVKEATGQTEKWLYLNGFCITDMPEAAGEIAGYNSDSAEEIWRKKFDFVSFTTAGGSIVGSDLVRIIGGNAHRITAISPKDGAFLWDYQQPLEMTVIGGDIRRLYLLDTLPFALNIETGQIKWVADKVMTADAGLLSGDTLLFSRVLYPSPCAEK